MDAEVASSVPDVKDQELDSTIHDKTFISNRFNQIGEANENAIAIAEAIRAISKAPLPVQTITTPRYEKLQSEPEEEYAFTADDESQEITRRMEAYTTTSIIFVFV